jgi:hypothetical protein
MLIRLLAGLILAVAMTGAAAAEDLALSGNDRWVAVASRQDLTEAISIANTYSAQKPRVVRAQNGWFAVILGPYATTVRDDRPHELRTRLQRTSVAPRCSAHARHQLPRDSMATDDGHPKRYAATQLCSLGYRPATASCALGGTSAESASGRWRHSSSRRNQRAVAEYFWWSRHFRAAPPDRHGYSAIRWPARK